MTSYIAGDYAGFESNNLDAYYGYEETVKVGGEEEWCFVAWRKSGTERTEIMRIPSSQLKGADSFECAECLLNGLAMLFDKFELKGAE